MARPHKQTVLYFPHDTDASEGKTLTIIQAKYGNDGYAFWFKLLQLLGKAPGHLYDFNATSDWEFLLAKTNQKDTETLKGILETLVVLGAIDADLYAGGIIWCQKFVDGVAHAYNRTEKGVPLKPEPKKSLRQIADILGFSESYLSQVATGKRPASKKLLKKCLSLGIDLKGVNVENGGVSATEAGVSVDSNSGNTTETPQTKLNDTKLNDTITPDWIDKDTWDAFLEMRKGKRAVPTEKAKGLLIKELEKLRSSGNDPNEVLRQSIRSSWTDVYPLKRGGQDGAHRQTSRRLPKDYRSPEQIFREQDAA